MAQVPVQKGSLGRVSFFNADDVAQEHRGWPLGAFVTDEQGVPLTDELEVKFQHYKVGDKRDKWAAPSPGVTLHIVVSGAQRQIFAPDGIEGTYIERIVRAGEANFWDNGVPHKWETIEPGLQITIRRLRD